METILAIVTALGLYSQTFVVIDLETETDTVVCMDATENLWEFQGIEDWQKGDIVSAIMTDNGTPDDVTDDEFVSIRYSGYIY